MVRPSVSYNINPGFEQYYDQYVVPVTADPEINEEIVQYSRFENTLFWRSWEPFFSMAYTITYGNQKRENEISSQSLMFSSNLELSPRWKVGMSSGYDFKNKGVTTTQFRFQRDLESWKMSFNWTPIGSVNTSWYFFIGIKSSVLSDIKYDKRRESDRQL